MLRSSARVARNDCAFLAGDQFHNPWLALLAGMLAATALSGVHAFLSITLRANQIREGHLSREQALELVARDNQPRWESIKWYCDIVGLDFVASLERINAFSLRA